MRIIISIAVCDCRIGPFRFVFLLSSGVSLSHQAVVLDVSTKAAPIFLELLCVKFKRAYIYLSHSGNGFQLSITAPIYPEVGEIESPYKMYRQRNTSRKATMTPHHRLCPSCTRASKLLGRVMKLKGIALAQNHSFPAPGEVFTAAHSANFGRLERSAYSRCHSCRIMWDAILHPESGLQRKQENLPGDAVSVRIEPGVGPGPLFNLFVDCGNISERLKLDRICKTTIYHIQV
jgi:hypothetical protein